MGKIVEQARRAVGAASGGVSAAVGLYQLAVSVEGAPIRARDKPATVRIFGIPIFERDESLNRYWFGVIARGKSKLAKRAIAAREGGNVP